MLSSKRDGATVLWVVVHTAEGILRAPDLVAFFNRSTNSSCHAVADDRSLIDNLVPYDRAAWTLRNGNPRSDNLELCGFAKWTRAQWLNDHTGMLNHAAIWIRSRCLARGIPIRKIGPADVAARRAGVIGHVDYTKGTGDGSHWDPGPGFPWDYVIAKANETARGALYKGGEDMQLVKGDKSPSVYVVWWAGPGAIAYRKHVPNQNEPGYMAALACGYEVKTIPQSIVDRIPFAEGKQ